MIKNKFDLIFFLYMRAITMDQGTCSDCFSRVNKEGECWCCDEEEYICGTCGEDTDCYNFEHPKCEKCNELLMLDSDVPYCDTCGEK
jgi:hypothetical protein